MSTKFAVGLAETMNESVTENGAVGYKTTYNSLVDLNFQVPSLRGMSEEEICIKFIAAYHDNEELALRWLFYLGDVREGLGERRSFKAIIKYMIANYTDIAKKILPLIPEYSRWDNIFVYMNTALESDMIQLVFNQLKEDIDNSLKNKQISLLGKWMPSNNTSSNATRILAKKFTKAFEWSDKQYRKTLSALRKYLDVTEVKTSSKCWSEIDYEKVPSKANIKYKDAFLRNDEARRREFLSKLANNEVKINSSVLYPHDIVHKYCNNIGWNRTVLPKDDALEGLWKALPNTISGNDSESVLVVQDGSGSMECTIPNSSVEALDVSIGLAIYTSERLSGPFKNMLMTFGSNPELVKLNDKMSLREKISIVNKNTDCGSTNIIAVFDKILQTAIATKCTQEELPKNILIVSDMEFDSGCYIADLDQTNIYSNNLKNNKLFDKIAQKYAANSYKLPKLIFWNVNARTNTIPVIKNDLGVNLVSGYSVNNLKMILSGECDPFNALKSILMTKRYDPVAACLK